jgi:3'(2'), 5'-bisphosphate nucleotidase
MDDSLDRLAPALGEIAVVAGAAIMDLYGRAIGRAKIDASMVTDADLAAEALILPRLPQLLPDVPILSEEAAAAGHLPPEAETFFAVDPLDGTREFLTQNGEFTVNIALIRGGSPICGAVYAPALGQLWIGAQRAEFIEISPGEPLNEARSRCPISVRPVPGAGLTAVASRSHLDPDTAGFLATLPIAESRSIGSSLKFCLLAQGLADVYPRFGPTMEWDTAAGHAVLNAAGGSVVTPDGPPLRYGKRAQQYRNSAFVAWGRRAPV